MQCRILSKFTWVQCYSCYFPNPPEDKENIVASLVIFLTLKDNRNISAPLLISLSPTILGRPEWHLPSRCPKGAWSGAPGPPSDSPDRSAGPLRSPPVGSYTSSTRSKWGSPVQWEWDRFGTGRSRRTAAASGWRDPPALRANVRLAYLPPFFGAGKTPTAKWVSSTLLHLSSRDAI